MKEPLPFLLRFARGAIGKEFVIKRSRYKGCRIKTKYPDMTRIVASMAQRKCRNLFREAVQYAKEVIAIPNGNANGKKGYGEEMVYIMKP